MLKRLLRVKDIAGILRMSISGVFALLRQGKIPGFRVGTQWRFDEDAFEEWLKEESAKRMLRIRKRWARDLKRGKKETKKPQA